MVFIRLLRHVYKTTQMCLFYYDCYFRNAINAVFDHVELIDVLDSNDSLNLQLLNRPELGVTFTK